MLYKLEPNFPIGLGSLNVQMLGLLKKRARSPDFEELFYHSRLSEKFNFAQFAIFNSRFFKIFKVAESFENILENKTFILTFMFYKLFQVFF